MKFLKIAWLLSGVILFLLLALSGCGSPPPTPPVSESEANSLVVKGLEYYNAGQLSEAKTEFLKAIELDPNHPEAYLGVGHAEQGLQHWAEAVKAFDKAIELDPTMPGAVYLNRGNAYVDLELWEKAIDDFDKAIELESNSPSDQTILIDAYKSRGHVYIVLGNDDQARRDFETVLTLDPNNPQSDEIKEILEHLKPQPVRSTPRDSLALCDWFVESQLIRAERVFGLEKYVAFYQKYGPEGFMSENPIVSNGLINALEEYLPYEREFIERWQQLGSTIGADDFWENELEAAKQRLAAFEKMIESVNARDVTQRVAAVEDFEQVNLITRASNAAMREVGEKCLVEPK